MADLSTQQQSKMDDQEFNAYMKLYYEHVFPYAEMHQWLSYGEVVKDTFARREFSFTVNERFIRWLSFHDKEAFKTALCTKVPQKIDIGAIYSVSPADQRTVQKAMFVPLQKEFCLDIDISEYDNVRFCGCKAAAVCNVCWPLMSCAMRSLELMLREVFGCENFMFVFSGRRGIHCWVADEQFKKLTNEARTAVIDFLQLYRGSDRNKRKVELGRNAHPTFASDSQLFELCLQYFLQIHVDGMELFHHPDRWRVFTDMIPDNKLADEVHKQLEGMLDSDLDGASKWQRVVDMFAASDRRAKFANNQSAFSNSLAEIVYAFVYPRLDANVSKQLNHLLKAPFCVHPSTGKLCVPIPLSDIDSFDPEEVPKIVDVIEAYNKLSADQQKKRYVHTSLEPSVRMFMETFVQPIERKLRENARAVKSETVDW